MICCRQRNGNNWKLRERIAFAAEAMEGGETGMKQGQTLCWCVWCGTELVAGGYCYGLDIGCLCPACLPEYARVVFRSGLVAVG